MTRHDSWTYDCCIPCNHRLTAYTDKLSFTVSCCTLSDSRCLAACDSANNELPRYMHGAEVTLLQHIGSESSRFVTDYRWKITKVYCDKTMCPTSKRRVLTHETMVVRGERVIHSPPSAQPRLNLLHLQCNFCLSMRRPSSRQLRRGLPTSSHPPFRPSPFHIAQDG